MACTQGWTPGCREALTLDSVCGGDHGLLRKARHTGASLSAPCASPGQASPTATRIPGRLPLSGTCAGAGARAPAPAQRRRPGTPSASWPPAAAAQVGGQEGALSGGTGLAGHFCWDPARRVSGLDPTRSPAAPFFTHASSF